MGVLNIDGEGIIHLRDRKIGYLIQHDGAIVDADALGSYANRWLMQHGFRVSWEEGVMQKLNQQQQEQFEQQIL